MIQHVVLYLLPRQFLRESKRLKLRDCFLINVNRRMVYRYLIQLRLSQRQCIYPRIYRTVTAIPIWAMADKQILDFDLVNYIFAIIHC